jgi:DNA-binding NtrC family response regulator
MKTSSLKILIVDDDALNLRLLSRYLSRPEFNLILTDQPEEALKLLEKKNFGALLTDLRMPNISGMELLKKAQSISPDIVKILLTAYADIEVLKEIVNLHLVDHFIEKPFFSDDIKHLIKNYLHTQIEWKTLEKDCSVIELRPEMINMKDIYSPKGVLLVSEGTCFSIQLIEKIKQFSQKNPFPYLIRTKEILRPGGPS